ncbi:MAG: S-layer homology domain-containing protein [Acidimicrobiales bacterium]
MRLSRRPLLCLLVASLSAASLTAVGPSAAADTPPPGGHFTDDDTNIHEGAIEAIRAEGITTGCAPTRYCPDEPVTRGQMAAFLNRALHLPPATTPSGFTDDDTNIHEGAIEAIRAEGITTGCAPTRYCPDEPVTRGQMAAFLNRALHLPPATQPSGFTDTTGTFRDDIERLRHAGITTGTSPTTYSPHRPVTRAEMATFLMRALHLDELVPPPREECGVLPADNIWNTKIDDLPVASRSSQWVDTIGATRTMHADFGAGEWPPGSGAPIGIPFVEVDGGEPLVPVQFTAYGSESDPGPYPIPLDAPREGGPAATSGDRHVLAIDTSDCVLYELFAAQPGAGVWRAQSGAVHDLRSNDLRPDGWTSADAAGLPILPGLVTYDEVESGVIDHALRFTAPATQNVHVWPARHHAGSPGAHLPPMGQRFRLRADFDLSGFSGPSLVILTALRDYGMILADNGSAWYLSGSPDERWDNDALRDLGDVPGSAFEAVDVSSLMIDPDSGAVAS